MRDETTKAMRVRSPACGDDMGDFPTRVDQSVDCRHANIE